jgi:Na+/glutamate symporter
MRYRKLRIAWSVACGVVAMLLCVLWVRSYWWADVVNIDVPTPFAVQFLSALGHSSAAIYESEQGWDWVRVNAELDPAMKDVAQQDCFGFKVRDGDWIILAPHWFLILLAGSIAVIPWLLYRFTLRTLLIATTLVAVVLGLIVYAVRR